MNTSSNPTLAQRAATKLIALVGNPNSGKTTLFNRLTGLRHKVANYPGVTVEHREGMMTGCDTVKLLDLPGCYSLTPRSLDERLARDALLGWVDGTGRPDGVIVVVDSSNLERNLFLATQVLELNLPTIIVCNMFDLVEARGDLIDLERLSHKLGATVISTVASKGKGLGQLRAAVASLGDQGAPAPWTAGGELQSAVHAVSLLIRRHNLVDASSADPVAMLLVSPLVLNESDSSYVKLPPALHKALADIHRKQGANGHAQRVSESIQRRYYSLSEIVEEVCTSASAVTTTISDRIDHIVTHKVWGLSLFSFLMAVMFLAIFSWSGPLMDGIDWLISSLGSGVALVLGEGMLADLLIDGVIAGTGNVVVFFPQICILFLFIGLMEDSGYMARVAFVMDRVMAGAGLHGRSFIPLFSSFACAVPAIMATRTIENRRDRLTTILVAPLMSCSARLPVYILMISALFGTNIWLKTGIMFGMYALGTVSALLMAWLLKRTILKGPTPTFIMELPPYRMPRLANSLRHTWDRSKLFLTQAGTIILAMSIVLWALAYFPRADQSVVGEPGVQLRESYMGRIGRHMEPLIEPLGFDWKIGVGLAASFAAREVFVATMGVVYGVGEEADEKSASLRERIAAANWPDGRKVYTPLVGISLMVFYVLACQCMSTLAVVRRETGSWRWPIFMFTYMTALAYAASFVVYQGGKALGLG